MMEVKSEYKMTEIGKIPVDWKLKKLEEVTTIVSGGTPSKENNKYWNNGDILWATPTDITKNKSKYINDTKMKISEQGLNESSASLLPEGSVLMTSRATIGEKSINLKPMATNQGFKSFICKNSLFNEYLYYYIEILKPLFLSKSSGSTFLELSKKSTEDQLIALPPLKEQQKIAEILSTVDEQIDQTDQLIKKTKELKKGLMQQLLTKGINHTEFKKSELGEIPRNWFVKGLKEISDEDDRYSFTGGPFGSNLTSKEYETTGVQIIQLQNIGEGYFNNSHKIFTSNTKADELSSCNIFPGEIVMAKMAEPVARACIVPTGEERYLMSSDAIRLKVDSKRYNTKYIMYSINHDYFRKQAVLNSTGTTRLRIGLTQLAKLNILCPPLAEQKEIADILSSVDEDIEGYEEEKAKYEELKKGLMQQLLTGKTRVKVD